MKAADFRLNIAPANAIPWYQGSTDCCHLMSRRHSSKDLKRKEILKLNF